MNGSEITSEHTCARAEQILAELESLRLEMGRKRDNRVPMQVRDAMPRETFYHALTVHRKADQLAVELGAEHVDAPQAKQPAIAVAADVLRVLDSTSERLHRARALLHLEGDPSGPEAIVPTDRDPGKTASDTLLCCLIASRQLDEMLLQAFDSREGQRALLHALGVMQPLLAIHGLQLPEAPPLERRKSPRDVFQVMWTSCQVLYKVLIGSGLSVLEVQRGYVGEEPTDVYDLATLIVSEVEYMASIAQVPMAPLAVPMPDRVLPVHNLRRAKQFHAAINLLEPKVRANPKWLREKMK